MFAAQTMHMRLGPAVLHTTQPFPLLRLTSSSLPRDDFLLLAVFEFDPFVEEVVEGEAQQRQECKMKRRLECNRQTGGIHSCE